MPAAALRSALARISLTRALVGLGVLMVAINVASAIWDSRADRIRTEQRAQRDFSNLTRLLAEQTAASLEAADVVLRDAMREGAAPRVAAMVQRLSDEVLHIPQIAAFLVIDADGRVLARTSETPVIDRGLAERPFFRAQRDRSAGSVLLSEPYFGGRDGDKWRFILSRRLNAPGGGFGGVIAAVMDVDNFDRLYRTIDLGPGGFMTLLSMEGVVITRVPDPSNARGRQYRSEDILQGIRREGAFQGWTTSPIVNERVLVSAAAVRGFPLFVASGSSERAVLAPWREQSWDIGLRTLLASAAMLALIALAAWGLARRERALQRSEKRFRAMIEHSADAVILTRPHAGGIFYASPAFQRITGYSLEDVRGRQARDLIHPDHQEAAIRLRDESLRVPGKVVVQEVLVRNSDGSWRWVENTISNLLQEPGVRAVVMNMRDITERKQAESERSRLEQRLRQAGKMEAVGRLAGGIAHDFNNILGGILGYAEMLVEGAAEGSALKRYAQNVLTAANRASALVEQILSYSRSQRGKKAPVDLSRIVAETLELVRGSLSSRIRLEVSSPATPLFVVGDSTQLHQIIMNLCTNALHAMGESGTLSVTLDAHDIEAERTLAQAILHPGQYARLQVEDSGSGMDDATLARIFEPFFTTKDIGKGTGLGLSLVYGIVTDAAGAIDVSSAVGRGSRFTIWLPRVESPVLAAARTGGR
jgi:PAS domain S-box-containing protein